MLIDTHIHVGRFFNEYYSPIHISQLMTDVGVDYYAVSSTTQCEENYAKVLEELHELIKLDKDKVLPIMWITPESLKGNIAWLLDSDIQWKCLKVHPELHPNDWDPSGSQFIEVIDIAKELSLPVLIHTGNKECCFCGRYLPLVASHPDVTFIMAHGRPTNDAIRIVESCDNAFVDSAFMPVDDMKRFVEFGLSSRLLWGTDMCIPQHYSPSRNLQDYYQDKLNALKEVCNVDQYEDITSRNAIKIFNIESYV